MDAGRLQFLACHADIPHRDTEGTKKTLIITDAGRLQFSACHADISHRDTEGTKKKTLIMTDAGRL